MNATTRKRNNGSTIFNILAWSGKGRSKMRTLILTACAVFLISIPALSQDEDFENDFDLGDDSTETESVDAEADEEELLLEDGDIEADVEADLGDLLDDEDEEESDTGGSKNPDLFEVKDGIMLVKLVRFVDRYWYTVINADYVARAKANAETQLGDLFAKVQLLFGVYGLQVPFTGPGEEIDTEMESAIISYAKGHGCEGNEQSDDCDTLFGKLEKAHSEATNGVDNSYTRNSTKLMETAAKYDGIKKIVLGLGALAIATPGVPEEQRPWDLSDSDFNGVPIDFGDIEKGNKIVTSGDDGLTGGTVIEKTDDGLTIKDENGDEHTASRDASFWTLGKGGSDVNFGSGIHFLASIGLLGLFGSDIDSAMLMAIDLRVMWTPKAADGAFGIFIGGSLYRAWGNSSSGFETELTDGRERLSGAGMVGAMAGVNISKAWRFEGTMAMLFNDGGIGGEATVGFTVTPTRVISIGFGARGGYYPGNMTSGSQEFGVGGSRSGPNLLDRPAIGGFVSIGFNALIGE